MDTNKGMKQTTTIRVAKSIVLIAAVPAILIGYAEGPPARRTGAPGEANCTQCHTGTAVNGGGGQVSITYSGGTSYTPGTAGKFTITITDSAARVYGFEASARLDSNTQNGQAGSFTAGTGMQVLTDAGVQFIEHTAPRQSGVIDIDWTPPAAGSGPVTVYFAANAANGNGNPTGDHIYTGSVKLTEAQATSQKPSITQGGVGDAFTGQTGVTSNGWTAIYGSNFASGTRTWDNAPELAQGQLPTSLDGVSVTINGKSAPVYFISPGQVNVLAPTDDATGDVQVVVKNAGGESSPITVRKSSVLPALYSPFGQNGRLFVTVVENSTGAILGKPGVETRATRAVKPGDVVQFYASGLGATNPAIPTNQVVKTPAALVNTPTIRINDVPVSIIGSALVGSGLYQINATIPDVPNGDQPIVLTIAGTSSSNNVFITVQR